MCRLVLMRQLLDRQIQLQWLLVLLDDPYRYQALLYICDHVRLLAVCSNEFFQPLLHLSVAIAC